MRELLPPIIIFAAGYTPNISEFNWMKNKLKKRGIPFKYLQGHWQGSNEYTFLTHARHAIEIQKLLVRAGQSFYIYADEDRNAELWNSHGVKMRDLGELKVVDKPKTDCYTTDPDTGNIWEASN